MAGPAHRPPLERAHLGLALAWEVRDAPAGRRSLVARTGLTESVVRTELEKLRDRGLVVLAKAGTTLAEGAARELAPVFARVRAVADVELPEVELDRAARAARVRGSVPPAAVLRCRDLAVREGATAALFLVVTPEGIALPDAGGAFADRNPEGEAALRAALGAPAPDEGVVVVFAPTRGAANAGLWRILDELVALDADRPDDRLARARRAVDAANSADPREVATPGGPRPFELAYADRLSDWVERLAGRPGPALAFAARAQHVRRWEIPRDSFPAGRKGYLAWRRRLQDLHVAVARAALVEAGYAPDDPFLNEVETLMRKRGLGPTGDAQVLEDALCLVTLETQLPDVLRRVDRPKAADVIRKTWAKMSEEGRRHALALALDADAAELVREALGGV